MMLLTVVVAGAAPVRSDENQVARYATDATIPFLVAGELLLCLDGKEGKREATQGAEALMATGIATELLKATVNEKRPNSDARDSFPSGHTSAAFAMATVLGEDMPQYKWPVYGAAAVIGWSRVEVGDHHWHDVIAGAALGHLIGKHFVNKRLAVTSNGVAFQTQW
ncbi:MAG: hypothetical protein AUJ92_21485 [Armatimonadetes bacterium CG2_30_59_28]|nr:phosphatase PAP2 family protein [Armatimonadota bacterium]OIO89423.1 MAG: hypothetical protein AUJ92_21485 [Armatimonadetes bacterium CG2_30_59_28]